MFQMTPSLYYAIQATVREEITSGLHLTQHLISLALRGRLRNNPTHPGISFCDPARSLTFIQMGVWPDLLKLGAASLDRICHSPILLNRMTRPFFRFLSIMVQNEAVFSSSTTTSSSSSTSPPPPLRKPPARTRPFSLKRVLTRPSFWRSGASGAFCFVWRVLLAVWGGTSGCAVYFT